MGDFNVPAHLSGQGYDRIRSDGWLDTHYLTDDHDKGITVPDVIDGWRERTTLLGQTGTRLDYIFVSRDPGIIRSHTIFNGINGPVVSDHFGMVIQTAENSPGKLPQ